MPYYRHGLETRQWQGLLTLYQNDYQSLHHRKKKYSFLNKKKKINPKKHNHIYWGRVNKSQEKKIFFQK
jgi:hypothetical protein